MTDFVRMTISEAEQLICSALKGSGAKTEVALSVAKALAAAEAEGQVGHGFSRLEDYAAQLRSGKINPAAEIQVQAPFPASISIDADCGFAYPALDEAIERGAEAAHLYGIASMSIFNSHHCGALSIQVEKLALRGLIGMMVANTPKAIAPWGAAEAQFGTNPIAFAAPRGRAPALVMDLSLSKVARGKVMNASKSGQSIPEGWALDSAGNPTTDPAAALQGTMVPIGEAKGTALALMVETLAAVHTGSALSSAAGSFFNADGPPPRVGQFLLAIKPGQQADGEGFAGRFEQLLGEINAAEGARLPGQRRLKAREAAQSEGLAVPSTYVDIARRLA